MTTEYNELLHITAGELRAMGLAIPENIPDVGWVPRSSITMEPVFETPRRDVEQGIMRAKIGTEFTRPFQWIEFTFTQDANAKDNDCDGESDNAKR